MADQNKAMNDSDMQSQAQPEGAVPSPSQAKGVDASEVNPSITDKPAEKPAAKAAPVKKTAPAKKAAPVKKAAPAKKAATAKKAAPAKKAATAKKVATVKKVAPVEEVATLEDVAPAEDSAPVKKAAPVKNTAPVEAAATDATTATEDESDEHSDDEQSEHDDHKADYGSKTDEELIDEAKRILTEVAIDQARVPMLAVRNVLTERWDKLKQQALEAFVKDGGNVIDFRFEHAEMERFYETFKAFKSKRSAYRKEQDKVMANNLATKQGLLAEVKALAESPDLPTAATYKNFKVINDRWTATGHVPSADARDLYATYRFLVDRFYDNLRLSQELRELDYKHNKGIKEQLIADIQALAVQKWSAQVGLSLQKLHESWKEAGPVSKDDKEVLWELFKAASNTLHVKRRESHSLAKAENKNRLVAKQVIVEAMDVLAQLEGNDHSIWQKGTNEAKSNREAMSQAGRTFGGESDALWDRFKQSEKAFFKARNQFYKDRKNAFKQAIDAKQALIVKAQALAELEDQNQAMKEVRELQAQWKDTGFVPRKMGDAAWGEFKTACDVIYHSMRKTQNQDRVNYKADQKKHAGVRDSKSALETAKRELSTLENNMGFFQFANPDSPIVKDALKKVDQARVKVEKADKVLREERKIIRESEKKAAAEAAAEEVTTAPTADTGSDSQEPATES
ncbi:MAG: DUF349 domain-containing protein [Schleiferiaceae bacterium]|nr:DUF349 domain-containing protein [Schleiferiaceae bacterium]